MRSLAATLTRLDIIDALEWPSSVEKLALRQIRWTQKIEEDSDSEDDSEDDELEESLVPSWLATQPLTRLEVLAQYQPSFQVPAGGWAAHSYAGLRCLDLRCMTLPQELLHSQPRPIFFTATSALPASPLPSLRVLMVGLAGAEPDWPEFCTVDVATLAAWPGAKGLSLLLIQGAQLVSSRADVAANLAANKPRLASVHLHACGEGDGGDDGAAVEALLVGRQRVCRCERAGECLFGQNWWAADE